jgi:hypothetical protein
MAPEFELVRSQFRRGEPKHAEIYPHQIEVKSEWNEKSRDALWRFEDEIFGWLEEHELGPRWDCTMYQNVSGYYHIFWIDNPRDAIELKLRYHNV